MAEWLKSIPVGSGGTVVAIASALGLAVWGLKFVRGFQSDFTDKYQARVKELEAEVIRKDRLIARLRLGVARAMQALIGAGVEVPRETTEANAASEDDKR